MTWTSLYDALLPQGLVKSGLIAYFHNLLPPERGIQRSPRSGTTRSRAATTPRSSIRRPALGPCRPRQDPTPVFMLQGRRDYAFDMAEALSAFGRLRGPKRIYSETSGMRPRRNRLPSSRTTARSGWVRPVLRAS